MPTYKFWFAELDELRLCTASFAESFLETPEENAPAKKTWTVFLVFLRVRQKSFDYSAAPTTRLTNSGFLYVLVVKRTFAIRFATCSWIVATSWLISGAFPPLMQACPLPPQMFLQFRGGDCLNDSHMCPQHDCFPVFPSKKNSERRKGLFHRCIFFCCFSKICVQKKQGYTFLSVACHLA